ncbi:MAG TPA: response regulator [Malonomonas sp.]
MARILIAEDSETELAYLQDILNSTPHEITTTRDGLAAEAAVRSNRFDLIILDVIMPGKNGFQVCRQLKTDPALKDIPVILLTSKSEASDKFWGKKQGANAYITKPYDPMELLLEMKKLLGGA